LSPHNQLDHLDRLEAEAINTLCKTTAQSQHRGFISSCGKDPVVMAHLVAKTT
jgi:hypothetical protein